MPRMMRMLFSFVAACVFSVSAMACELDTVKRASQVATYIEQAQACLEAPAGGFYFDAKMERAFLGKINQERTKRRLRPLNVRKETLPAARFHSLDMGYNNFFDHKSLRGRSHRYRLTAFDRTGLFGKSSENIAKSAQSCVNSRGVAIPCREARNIIMPSATEITDNLHRQLMDSPGHRRNILDPDVTHIAIGVARGRDGFYVTQLFSEPVGQLQRPLPTQFPSGRAVSAKASLPGWTIAGLAYARDSRPSRLRNKRLPIDLRGDVALQVLGENRTVTRDGGRTTEIIETYAAEGPQFTVTPATGS